MCCDFVNLLHCHKFFHKIPKQRENSQPRFHWNNVSTPGHNIFKIKSIKYFETQEWELHQQMFVFIWILLSVGVFCNKIMFGLTSLISLHPFPWESHDLLFSYTETEISSYRSIIFRLHLSYLRCISVGLTFISAFHIFFHISPFFCISPAVTHLIRPLSETSHQAAF